MNGVRREAINAGQCPIKRKYAQELTVVSNLVTLDWISFLELIQFNVPLIKLS